MPGRPGLLRQPWLDVYLYSVLKGKELERTDGAIVLHVELSPSLGSEKGNPKLIRAARELCPARFEIERRSTTCAKERCSEIFDLVSLLGGDREPIATPVAYSLRADFGIGGSSCALHLWLVHQPERHVEHMHAQVD